MKYPQLNIFAAWFFIPETLAMGWVAAAGRMVLEMGGVEVAEGAIPTRIVGALLLLASLFLIRIWLGGVLPIVGNPGGSGYRLGHKLILAGNVLASLLFVFPFMLHLLSHPDAIMVLTKFTTAFGYWVMALWAIGFSFVYQSTLPVEKSS